MEFDLWAQLPSVLPEVGLVALAIVVLFADIYGSPATRRGVVTISAVGMALLALVPLIWLPDPAYMKMESCFGAAWSITTRCRRSSKSCCSWRVLSLV